MKNERTNHKTMGTLLVADVGLLLLSGIPAFKHADSGWKWAVGAGAWLGFVVLSVALIGFAVATVVRRRLAERRQSVAPTAPAAVGRARRTALWGAVALLGAMAADLAETIVDPASSGESTGVYQAAVQHHDGMVVSGYLLLASAILILPGILLLTRGLRDRGNRLRQVAVTLGFMGALGHAVLAAAYLAWASMPGERADDPQVVAALERMMGAGAIAPLAIGFIAFPLSIIATHGALLRARVSPRWLLAPVVAAPVAAIAAVGGDVASTATALVLLMTATAVVTLRIARGAAVITTDVQVETTPRSGLVPAVS